MRNAAHQLIFVLLLIGLGACGGRQQMLSSTFSAVRAADDGFATWDRDHQDSIVTHATSLADGEAKLGAYRGDRARVEAAFVVAYKALAAALLDSDSSTVDVVEAASALYQAIAGLQGRPETSPATPSQPAAPTTTLGDGAAGSAAGSAPPAH